MSGPNKLDVTPVGKHSKPTIGEFIRKKEDLIITSGSDLADPRSKGPCLEIPACFCPIPIPPNEKQDPSEFNFENDYPGQPKVDFLLMRIPVGVCVEILTRAFLKDPTLIGRFEEKDITESIQLTSLIEILKESTSRVPSLYGEFQELERQRSMLSHTDLGCLIKAFLRYLIDEPLTSPTEEGIKKALEKISQLDDCEIINPQFIGSNDFDPFNSVLDVSGVSLALSELYYLIENLGNIIDDETISGADWVAALYGIFEQRISELNLFPFQRVVARGIAINIIAANKRLNNALTEIITVRELISDPRINRFKRYRTLLQQISAMQEEKKISDFLMFIKSYKSLQDPDYDKILRNRRSILSKKILHYKYRHKNEKSPLPKK